MEENKGQITLEDARRMLNAAVAEKGWHHIYNNPNSIVPAGQGGSCKYVHNVDGEYETGCIIGHILVTNGYVTLTDAADHNHGTASLFMDRTGIRCTDEAARLFRRVQIWQDKGVPWGAAVLMGENIPGHMYPGGSD
jgi:hypothetical protein